MHLSDPTFGDNTDVNRLYNRRSELYHQFKARFNKEYLSFLREIHSLHTKKHQSSNKSINLGDVILVVDTDKPQHHRELGVVRDLILGADNFCRSTIGRTPCGRTSRSIVKLYPLEVHIDLTDSTIKGLSEKSMGHSMSNHPRL